MHPVFRKSFGYRKRPSPNKLASLALATFTFRAPYTASKKGLVIIISSTRQRQASPPSKPLPPKRARERRPLSKIPVTRLSARQREHCNRPSSEETLVHRQQGARGTRAEKGRDLEKNEIQHTTRLVARTRRTSPNSKLNTC